MFKIVIIIPEQKVWDVCLVQTVQELNKRLGLYNLQTLNDEQFYTLYTNNKLDFNTYSLGCKEITNDELNTIMEYTEQIKDYIKETSLENETGF